MRGILQLINSVKTISVVNDMVSKTKTASASSSSSTAASERIQETEVQKEVDTNSGDQEVRDDSVVEEEANNDSGEEEVGELAPRVLDVWTEWPETTVDLLRSKQAFNIHPNTAAAAKALSDFVSKTGSENRQKVDIPAKAKNYLELMHAC